MESKTSDALMIIHRTYYEGNPERQETLMRARESAAVARRIYELRLQAGLTQAQLAKLVGTTASVISRIEDDDYDGKHSVSLLMRIAEALNHRLQILFLPRSIESAESVKAESETANASLG